MNENQSKLNQLLLRLEIVMKRQEVFQSEINELRKEVNLLKTAIESERPEIQSVIIDTKQSEIKEVIIPNVIVPDNELITEKINIDTKQKLPTEKISFNNLGSNRSATKQKSDIEKFIGENLFNKIGIIILVIGVALGAKYAIDHQLMSPVTRIILGYITGIVLLGFSFKLRKNFENFSAVLLSGSMAIMYLITFAAYSVYNLYPQLVAFLLMVIFTVFTVHSALSYNRQIIAHIGLVGAYAVPFLVSENSGKVSILFSYMAIINIGILVIAFKKYWKPLYYTSFFFTWLIYLVWYNTKYDNNDHFSLSLTFLVIFYIIFYITFLSYKLLQKEKFKTDDIALLLSNSFIFYGLGYSIMSGNSYTQNYLGAFTIVNAILHGIVGFIVYSQQHDDKSLFWFITGLSLVFVTIAIPVQFSGRWVTVLWSGEAALLFWIGRSKNSNVYEILSYPLMVLAFISLLIDWNDLYGNYSVENPDTQLLFIFNTNFLVSIFVIISYSVINIFNFKIPTAFITQRTPGFVTLINFAIPSLLAIIVYFSFYFEIDNYWQQHYVNSGIKISPEGSTNSWSDYIQYNTDIQYFKSIWLINYSIIFCSILSLLNIKFLKRNTLGIITIILSLIFLVTFLTESLYNLSNLRDSYLTQSLAIYYKSGIYNIIIRYISIMFFAGLLIVLYYSVNQNYTKLNLRIPFEILLQVSIIWILSSELLNCMQLFGYSNSYKLALSILWGINSLALTIVGIWKAKKHLRIAAIALFGITLIKLFFYDISHLSTLSKTIVFLLLGALLLLISFLYNKFKSTIFDEKSE